MRWFKASNPIRISRRARGRVDHAYILVNTNDALASVKACAKAGVRVATLLAGGFADAGPAGLAKQQELLAAARDGGMRLIGPNCLGLVNFHTGLTLTATPALNTKALLPGNLMVLSQSGSIMGALVSRGFARGIGFSKAISVGNEADLTVGDIGEAFVDDPDTSAFLVFLETLRDADALARFARMAFERNKPIVAYKLGRSAVGREMAVSHTGALVGSDRAVDAFLRYHGIVRVDHLETLFELPALLIGRRPPKSDKPAVGVVTTTGGGAALVVDRLGLLGVETRAPRPESLRQLAAHGLAVNPGRVIDLTMAGTRYDAMKAALDALRAAPEFDLILAVVGNSAEFNSDLAVRPIADAGGAGKPVVAFLGPNADIGLRMLADANVPAFRTPESCADAIHAYLTWRAPSGPVAEAATLPAATLQAIRAAQSSPNEMSALALFHVLGVPTVPAHVMQPGAPPPDVIYPVVAKVLSPDVAHKTEAGGVILNIASDEQLADAARRIVESIRTAHPHARIEGVLIQSMERGLAEVLVGYRRDPQAGPLVTLAAGGILAEIYDDSAVRLAPVDEATALKMIDEIKGLAPIRGYRNLPLGRPLRAGQDDHGRVAACADSRSMGRGDQPGDREGAGCGRRGRAAVLCAAGNIAAAIRKTPTALHWKIMSELRAMLLDANERLLKDYCGKEVVLASEDGVWAQALWGALEEAGITKAVASEEAGGSGIELSEALRLAGSAAAFCAPIPLGENYLATWILGRAGLPAHDGPATIAPSNPQDVLLLERQRAQWRLTGLARRVPWARHANAVVVVASCDGRDHVALVPASGYSVRHGSNIAREARDTLTFDALLGDDLVARRQNGLRRLDLHALGAALRTVQLAAALGPDARIDRAVRAGPRAVRPRHQQVPGDPAPSRGAGKPDRGRERRCGHRARKP